MSVSELILIAGALAAGLVLGWLGAVLRTRTAADHNRMLEARRLAGAEATAEAERTRRAATEGELRGVQELSAELDRRLAVSRERLESSQRALDEQREFLETSKSQLEVSFKALAAGALRGSTEQFLSLAEQRLKTSEESAAANLEEKQKAIESMLEPLGRSLETLARHNAEIEQTRAGAYSQLDEQLRTLQAATSSLSERATALTTTLKGSSGKGRWGEIALRNIAEIAGLSEHIDFEEQRTTKDGGRPDMTVRLPGNRLIAIDAKAPVKAYLEAAEATTETARKSALDRHVREVKAHVRALAGRDYAAALGAEIDMVVMFLPSDSLLSEAYSREPDLQIEALRSRVLLATPTTLVALLRTVAIYWQQRALAENAAEIASVAGILYERAAKFGAELAGVGKSLQGAIEAYNRAVGSFDYRLLPMARRLEGMKVAETSRRKVETPPIVDDVPRMPRYRKS